ncbi:MAG: glycoside hydrolase family 13 [Blastochloris sp.]|nr:glycoside hydrolase family 13 [Blastochloris sp.]
MIIKECTPAGKVRVTFSMPASIWADTIHLVGDFNDWDTSSTPLRLGDHGWSVCLELDVEQAYQYRYLVNGSDWYNDWRADSYVPNEYGGDNSVVITLSKREARSDDRVVRANEHAPREFAYDMVQKKAHSYGNRNAVLTAMKHMA